MGPIFCPLLATSATIMGCEQSSTRKACSTNDMCVYGGSKRTSNRWRTHNSALGVSRVEQRLIELRRRERALTQREIDIERRERKVIAARVLGGGSHSGPSPAYKGALSREKHRIPSTSALTQADTVSSADTGSGLHSSPPSLSHQPSFRSSHSSTGAATAMTNPVAPTGHGVGEQVDGMGGNTRALDAPLDSPAALSTPTPTMDSSGASAPDGSKAGFADEIINPLSLARRSG